MYQLTTSAVAVATYGVILHTSAAARREFCIAIVGEATDTDASFDDIASAAKVAVDYDGMEDAERASFRKQIQYCRAIVTGWNKLGVANQRAFVGGSLPASSAEKLLKAKAKPPVDKTETAADTGSDTGSGSETSVAAASVLISGPEAAIRFASWLDTVDPSTLTEAEALAIKDAAGALEAFRAKVAGGVQLQIAA